MNRDKMGETFNFETKTKNMEQCVYEFKMKYLDLWWETSNEFPIFKNEYTNIERKRKEKETDYFLNNLIDKLKSISESNVENLEWEENLLNMFKDFASNTLEFSSEWLDILFSDGFVKATKDFIRKARDFDPDIKIEDIVQAIRNVWIMNSIQTFLGLDINFTPSVFAYSMLYPYSDNFLDDPHLSIEAKNQLNKNFQGFLKGESQVTSNHHEADILKLVKIIEGEYCRNEYPHVFDSLLSIHKGQVKSLYQQSGKVAPYERDIMGISFEKGGTSVLADGYLVKESISEADADFLFGYGIILQLADDLQDVRNDLDEGHMTIFSQLADKWYLDGVTNHLINFVDRVISSEVLIQLDRARAMKNLISTSCILLILTSIAKNSNVYSKNYIKRIEKYSLYRFAYLKKIDKKMKKLYSSINMEKLIKVFNDSNYGVEKDSI